MDKLSKEDFITVLSSATPEDLNRIILEKGKKPKPIWPIYFFRNKYKIDKNGGLINVGK